VNTSEAVWVGTIILTAFLLIALTLLVGTAIPIAVQARWRGYSLWLWLAAVIISINPVIFLVLLALMPNRARKMRRETFRNELDAKLAGRSGKFGIARMPTDATGLSGSTLPERSLGDMPTVAPPERSIGDEMTCG
jgi:hypothetical protein